MTTNDPEIRLLTAFTEGLASFGPKTRGTVAEAMSSAIETVLDSNIEPDAARRALAYAVDRARAEAKAAEDEYTRRRNKEQQQDDPAATANAADPVPANPEPVDAPPAPRSIAEATPTL